MKTQHLPVPLLYSRGSERKRCYRAATVKERYAVLLTLAALYPAHPAAPVKKTITITEGTSMAATVSPDGKTILLGLHTGLWSLAFAGGTAKLMTNIVQDAVRPDWSPKGDWIAFQSYASGGFHIWIMKPDGSGMRQLTNGHGDD